MTESVERITKQVRQLPRPELDELLDWLAEFEASEADAWDRQIEEDSKPGGRMEKVLERVRKDIAEGSAVPSSGRAVKKRLQIEKCKLQNEKTEESCQLPSSKLLLN